MRFNNGFSSQTVIAECAFLVKPWLTSGQILIKWTSYTSLRFTNRNLNLLTVLSDNPTTYRLGGFTASHKTLLKGCHQ